MTPRSCARRRMNCDGCWRTRSPKRPRPAWSPTWAWGTPCGTTWARRCAARPRRQARPHRARARRPVRRAVRGLRWSGRAFAAASSRAMRCRARPSPTARPLRLIARAAGVRFGGAIVVLPDDDVMESITELGKVRGTPVVVVSRSALSTVLRRGMPEHARSAATRSSTSGPGCNRPCASPESAVGGQRSAVSGRQSVGSGSDQTASSLPAGSSKWNRRPPGNA